MSMQLYYNAQIFTAVDPGTPLKGKTQGKVQIYSSGVLLVKNGNVAFVGDEKDLTNQTLLGEIEEKIDCHDRCLIPGFVDPHTHMCFAKTREEEFGLRISGTPYLEILAQGGGILSSVRSVRETDQAQLAEKTLAHIQSALGFGTTTVEIKSGYGLDTKNELKMLAAIDDASRKTPVDVVPTFMGAHAIPEKYREKPEKYISLVIDEMLPAVKEQGIARFCDVFCEKGVFTIDQTRQILSAAQKIGLGVKLHADEVHDLGGAGLAADLHAISADHLLAASDANFKRMAKAGVVANLLPATAYSLRKPYARARRMIELGLPVALATDCNPGSSFTESMPFVIGLAIINMNMTPFEALNAATINSAYSLGLAEKVGTLDMGKQADFLLIDGNSPAILAYHAGVSPISAVYKKGVRVA